MARTPEQTEIYRRMTPQKRLEAGFALHDFAFNRLVHLLSREHPHLADREIKILATKRMLGEAAGVL